VLFGCGSSLPNYDYSQEPDPRKSEYVIGVADQLRVTVWKNPDQSGQVRVRPDGTITLPLIGDLKAAGRTPTQLRALIQERQKAFVKDETATVTVAVIEVASYRFTVAGEVQNAGMFTSTNYVTVIEAIAMAGGLTRFAKRDEIFIVRRDKDGNTRQVPISYDAIAKGGHDEMNLALLAGDTVFVP